MASLQFNSLYKRYPNGFEAVTGFDLEVKSGEFLVLVGPSGCGKSTTLRMVAGLEEVSEGSISIDGKDVTMAEPAARDIAMVFQNYALYPHMNVRENMAFGLTIRKLPHDEIDRLVNEAAEILSLTPLLDRRPKELSGGQRQRVALGRAIVRQPKVFLFDEPLSNLDAKLRVQMRTEVALLHQNLGATMIYVTHDQVEAMTLGDRIVVMKDGLIQQVDSPLNLYRHPVNRFVAGFIGSPAMSFLDGSVQNQHFTPGPLAETSNGTTGAESTAQAVQLGVRPEDLTLDPSAPRLGEAVVQVVEHMGHETLVHLDLNGQVLVARLEPELQARSGDKVMLGVHAGRGHLFSLLDDGERLDITPQFG
jgi:multiple sugar transport system ATP-binding protein